MSKVLEDLKKKLIDEFYTSCEPVNNGTNFGCGFDAAIGLELPVLFAEWVDINGMKKVMQEAYTPNGKPCRGISDLYSYWLENIYPQPSKKVTN